MSAADDGHALDPRLRRLSDDNVAEWTELDPCQAIIAGVAVANAKLTGYSTQGAQARATWLDVPVTRP